MKKLKILSFICAILTAASLCGCELLTKSAPDDKQENGIVGDGGNEQDGSQDGAGQNGSNEDTENQGDGEQTDTEQDGSQSGGQSSDSTEASRSELTSEAEDIVAGTVETPDNIPEGATEITGKITISEAGDYFVSTVIEGKKITVESEGVNLYLSGATLSNEKKVIESVGCGLTITLFGENTISNSNADGSNAIDCEGDLIINGEGSLTLTSTKNGIKANSITVTDATLTVNSDKDGLHAEVDAYDAATTAPEPSYDDGGYVYLNGATVNITSADDGIQADTFVYIEDSTVSIKAGGGAPTTVTSTTSDNASGKGIKAGALDWGENATDLEWEGYLVCIKSGTITVDSNDDAVHSDGDVDISGGVLTLSSGDDGVHAEYDLIVSGGSIEVLKCYEGLEGTNIDISGGEITVTAVDDGINAAGGADNSGFGGGWSRPGMGGMPGMGGRAISSGADTSTPYVSITGGVININSTADGIDSNGNLTVSGGEIYISGPVNGVDSAIDYDGTAVITGGIVVAVCKYSGMTQSFGSSSTQQVLSLSASGLGTGEVRLEDSSGNLLVSYTPSKSYSAILISCPQIVKGGTYVVYACGKTTTVTK